VALISQIPYLFTMKWPTDVDFLNIVSVRLFLPFFSRGTLSYIRVVFIGRGGYEKGKICSKRKKSEVKRKGKVKK
jgi:hypothetical protein